jgi:hypothetical protein
MAIVFLAAIPLGLFGIATLEARARANEAAAARAQELAESGLAHALAILNGPLAQVTTANLLLGPNGVWNGGTGDDGLLIDSVATGETGLSAGWWQVAPSTGIPSIGSARLAGGKYYVRVIEDPAEDVTAAASTIGGFIWGGASPATTPIDQNGRVMLQCLGVTTDGAQAVTSAIVDGRRAATGILVGGDLKIASSVTIRGACGFVHANGAITSTSSSPSSARKWSTAVSFTGQSKLSGQLEQTAPVFIPSLDPIDMCTRVTLLAGGALVNVPVGDLKSQTWDIKSNALKENTVYCVPGNVLVSKGGNVGQPTNPRRVTIIAQGSIAIEEETHLAPATTQGYTLISGGDLAFRSYSKAGTLWGTAYCRAQLDLNADINVGNALITPAQSGQFVCLSENNTGKTMPADWVNRDGANTSSLNSRADLTFNCVSALLSGVLRTATFPSFGN